MRTSAGCFVGLQAVVLLLLSGLLIGRSGLGLVEPLDLGLGLETTVGLLVSLVLFDGGLNLRLPGDTIKATVLLRISLARLVLSFGAAMLAAHWLAGLGWSLSAVYSAIVLSTGPTVVTPIVQQIRLASPLGDVLEAEGLVLEPVGAVLALLLLELLLGDLYGWKGLAIWSAVAARWRGAHRFGSRLAFVRGVAAPSTGAFGGTASADHAGRPVPDVLDLRVASARIRSACLGGCWRGGGASSFDPGCSDGRIDP